MEWDCLVYVEWLLRAMYTWVHGGLRLRVHLWIATQEQRDLVGLHCFSWLPVQPYGIMGSAKMY